MTKKNRVYGLVGIKSLMSNWNADFTGYPKTTSSSEIFGSDKALKYPMKKMWQHQDEKVLYIKSFKIVHDKKNTADKLQPRVLKEQYENLFNDSDLKSSTKVLENLFSAIDVMNFGATFAESNNNISITGAVQIGQGYNKYTDTNILSQDILSPFSTGDKKQSSIGTKIVTDEAHYVYPFSVNPQNYKEYLSLGIENFEGYTESAYEKFKQGCLISATAFNTNSKVGCENEFALFIECKDDSLLYLSNLDSYVILYKDDLDFINIDLSKLNDLIKNHINEIEKIDLYYNKVNTKVILGDLNCNEHNII